MRRCNIHVLERLVVASVLWSVAGGAVGWTGTLPMRASRSSEGPSECKAG